ncbi:hypothetical protein EYF80_035265 [Liparis tanakae]|uniref:Uncharacterized protein n=1 Tax=Liparis tanakae TaxID=230148 RepID=A0A4Z2GPG1_9TELE|nr:hypothetical protein EYF80_035265 [Liparis tanakae]
MGRQDDTAVQRMLFQGLQRSTVFSSGMACILIRQHVPKETVFHAQVNSFKTDLIEISPVTLAYLSWWVGGVRRQRASWEVLPKKQCLFSLLPGQTVAIILKLTFTSKDVIQGSYLRGDGVNLHPDSVRLRPGDSRAGQTVPTRTKLASVVVGPDGAR